MPAFIITTDEDVSGTYRVEADDEESARAAFGDPGIDWARVEQISYDAYSLDVTTVAVVVEGGG
jgi:hypothetical protein